VEKNPFYPNYGIEPALLIGRDKIFNDLLYGIENGPGDPNRSTVIRGPRGMGKTVILKELAGRVMELGWITVYANQSLRLLDKCVII
jgi:predicted AAA+ superfamily ATPase